MEDTIVINGRTYKLVEENREPVKETVETIVVAPARPGVVKKAESRPYDYKERYRNRQVRISDIQPQNTGGGRSMDVNPDTAGGEGNLSRQAGYNVWVGEGSTIDAI